MRIYKESIHHDADPAMPPDFLAEYNEIQIKALGDQRDDNKWIVIVHGAQDAKSKGEDVDELKDTKLNIYNHPMRNHENK